MYLCFLDGCWDLSYGYAFSSQHHHTNLHLQISDLTCGTKRRNYLQSPKEWVIYFLIVNKHSPKRSACLGESAVHSNGVNSSFRVEF